MKIKRSVIQTALKDIGVSAAITGTNYGEGPCTVLTFTDDDDAMLFMVSLTMRLSETMPTAHVWSIFARLHKTRTQNGCVVRFQPLELEG